MSFTNVPIPAAAQAAGMTRLVFSEDFESDTAIDFSGEGKKGYHFYADRGYGRSVLTPDECQVRDSVLYMKPVECDHAVGLASYSKAGHTGFTMHYGYAEARIRAGHPTGDYDGVPAFWGMGMKDYLGEDWRYLGELDVVELFIPHTDATKKIYAGSLHEHYRNGIVHPSGWKHVKYASNLINATGYQDNFDFIDNDWHTYGALWQAGEVVWYLDGKRMHSARYNATDLPQYYYRDDPTPLPRIEDLRPGEFDDRTWAGAHHAMERENLVMILGCNYNWPMEVDWVRIWT